MSSWIDNDLIISTNKEVNYGRLNLSQSKKRKRKPKDLVSDENQRITHFSPLSMSELVVNKRKIKEFDDILKNIINPEIIVISGPPGCGKTSTIFFVAQKYNYRIVSWKDRDHFEFSLCQEFDLSYESTFEKFCCFIKKNSMYSTLNTSFNSSTSECEQKLILVELDHSFILKESERICDFFNCYKKYFRHSIIIEFVSPVGDKIGMFQRSTKFDYVNHYIRFNPLTVKSLEKLAEKCLESTQIENADSQLPPHSFISSLAISSNGDARQFLTTLKYYLVPISDDLVSDQSNIDVLASLNSSSKIDVFHFLGKLMYNKNTAISSKSHQNMTNEGSFSLSNDILELIDHFSQWYSTSSFNLLIHQNICHFSTEICQIKNIMTDISLTDMIRSCAASRYLDAFQLLESGLFFVECLTTICHLPPFNKRLKSSTFFSFSGSKFNENLRKFYENRNRILSWSCCNTRETTQPLQRINLSELVTHDLSYLSIIHPTELPVDIKSIAFYPSVNTKNRTNDKNTTKNASFFDSQMEMSLSDDILDEIFDSSFTTNQKQDETNVDEYSSQSGLTNLSDIESFSSEED